jgi:hypothetical protein
LKIQPNNVKALNGKKYSSWEIGKEVKMREK